MRNDPFNTLERLWKILRAIPRWPLKTDAKAIHAGLLDDNHKTTRRTIERDLKDLALRFPIVVDETSKPFGWSWAKDANFEFMPRLTTVQCVALNLVREHTRNLLPVAMRNDLAPLFDAATRELKDSGWRDWHRRIIVKPPTLELLPPTIDATVLADVQHAIARRVVFTASYRRKGNKTPIAMVVHPQGMLLRGTVQYALGTLFDGTEIRHLALHRMDAVELGVEPCRDPPGFDFQTWAKEKLALVSRGRICLVARFDPLAADHLTETPLSKDQIWQPIENGARVEVTASVENDELLRWWLLAFGPKVEVIEPVALREMIADDLRRAVAAYSLPSTKGVSSADQACGTF